jgi:hypothetical protein
MHDRLVRAVKWCPIVILAMRLGVLQASEPQGPDSDDSREVLAQDRTCAIEVPNDWNLVVDQTGRSVISVGDLVRGQFLSVSVVAKDDFDGSMTDVLNQAVSEVAIHMESRTESQPVSCQIGGASAEQVRLTGTENRFKYIYTLTIVESKTHFYRILTFTKPSTETEAEQVYAKVLSTFKPLDPKS